MTENEDSTWGISVLRSKNLQQFLSGGNWIPVVKVSVDPHLGFNHCKLYEIRLGSDGQNPNSKVLLDIMKAHLKTKLSFEIILKKKTRRSKGTVIGSGVYEICELVKLRQEKTRSASTITINLSASASESRGNNIRRDSKSSYCPSLQIKLIPPRTMAKEDLCECEEEVKIAEECREQDNDHLDSETEETPSEGPILPPPGIRRRRRRRVLAGFVIDSGDEAEVTWISESEPEEEEESPPCYDDEDMEDEDATCQDPIPPSLPWILRVSSILGMSQPNPGILPSYTMSNEQAREDEAKRVKALSDMIVWEWWERLLCLFTVYRELRVAQLEEETSLRSGVLKDGKEESYQRIYQWLQVEWSYVGGLLMGLAAIDAAVFAISPSSSPDSSIDTNTLFDIDSQALSAMSLSTTATGLGLLCDTYFVLRYGWGLDVKIFVNRALSSSSHSGAHSSWAYFAISSRIPALCMLISILSLVIFLLLVAWKAAPPAGLWFLGVLVGTGMWMRYLVWVVVSVSKGVRWVVTGGALWLFSRRTKDVADIPPVDVVEVEKENDRDEGEGEVVLQRTEKDPELTVPVAVKLRG